MNDRLKRIEEFFKIDLEIKQMLHQLVPPYDVNYDQEYVIRYSDKLFNDLQIIKYYMVRIINSFDMEITIDKIDELFNGYVEKLSDCGLDFNKLKRFYNDYISDMRESFIDEVNTNCCGYLLDRGYGTINSAKTVNELLHFFHHNIINNEEYFQGVPIISTRNNDFDYPITLYGKENIVAKSIYEKISNSIDSSYTDILSLNNKVIIMVRDKGHALSIEININGNDCDVKYFIPKICNAGMVNDLRGVKKVGPSDKFTVGDFGCDINTISSLIVELIDKVPGDRDMYIADNLESYKGVR